MTTTVKITELSDIGANLASSTVVPVVNMAGTPITQKTNIGNIANLILEGAGVDYPEATVALLAQTVSNAAQPNITSVGTLTTLTVSGNTNLGAVANVKITGGTDGYVLQTDGAGNLSWTAQTGGGGGGSPGGANTQIQFNDAGSFGGNTGFTFNKTTGIFASPFLAGNGNGLSNIQGANISGAVGLATYATTANAVAGSNVSGAVSLATYATTANAVAAANVSGLGNLALLSKDGNASNVLHGDGSWSADTTTYGNSNVVTLLSAFGSNTISTTGNVSAGSLFIQQDIRGNGALNLQGAVNGNTTINIGSGVGGDIDMVSNLGNINLYTASNQPWIFDQDGNLTLPGNTFAVNYANGSQVSIGAGNISSLVNGGNSFVLDSDGSVTFQGATPGQGVDRGLEWDFGANANGVNSQVRQDNNGLTVRAWTENGGGISGYSAPVNIVTNESAGTKTWKFDGQGNLTVPGDIQSGIIADPFELAITNITTGSSTVIVTVSTDWFEGTNEGEVKISGVTGTTQANGIWGYASVDTDQFQLYTDATLSTPVNGTTWTAYVSGGTALAGEYTDLTIQGGNVTIGSNLNRWVFDPTGNLTIPNGANIAIYGNTTQINTCRNGFLGLNSYDAGGNNIARIGVSSADTLVGIGVSDPITENDYNWSFNNGGGTVFPTLTVDLHNGGNQSAQTLQFGDSTKQAVITGPTPAAGDSAQRLIIQGQRASGQYAEGGDVYVWGGDSDYNGGDIKIYAGDSDGATGGGGYINLSGGQGADTGGYINIDGGYGPNGSGGYINITGGTGGNSIGGNIQIQGGQSGGTGVDGANVLLVGGYSQSANGGAVTLRGGQSALGLSGYGNVLVQAGASTWTFDNTGVVSAGGNFKLAPDSTNTGAYLDIFLTSGPDVHLVASQSANLILGQDNQANVMTSWNGNVTIQSWDTGANIQGGIWTFDGDGNLSLPSGGSVYSEGFTPSGNPGNTITLNPHGSGSITNQKLMVYPTAGDGDHLHMATGNLYQTELFLGSDDFYVKLANTGNVVIYSNDSVGNVAQWTFGTDGLLTLPGSNVTIGSVLGGEAILANNTAFGVVSQGANASTVVQWIDDISNATALSAVYINGTTGNVGDVQILTGEPGANAKIWNFGTDGNLTLPANTFSVNYANGTQVSLGGSSVAEASFSIQSSNFNATAGSRYGVNTSGGAVTATLPASPTTGVAIFFADAGGAYASNNLTIDPNGGTIMGASGNMTVSTNNQSVGLFYNGTTWRTYNAG